MKVDINRNSLKKLIRQLRGLADEFQIAIEVEPPSKKKPSNVIAMTPFLAEAEAQTREVADYYKSIQPVRGKKLLAKSVEWNLISKRLKGGYSVSELKTAILANSKDPWWIEKSLHSITDIMKKENNLQRFIHASTDPKGGNDAKRGYNSGSKEFTDNTKGFGD